MSNNVIFYTQIASIIAFIISLFVLYRLLVEQKEATIQLLKEKNQWLEQQLAQAKDTRPDVLAERLSKRNALQKEELEQLSKEFEANHVTQEKVKAKEEELATTLSNIAELKSQLERAEEVLGELEYYKDQFGCPSCGAELTTLAGQEEEYRAYSCGRTSGPNGDYPCPYDPEFPKFEDYELEIRQLASGKFFCNPKAKNKNAYKLSLQGQPGETAEEAKQKIKTNYERFLPKRLHGE